MKSNTKQDRVKELYLADLPPRACSVYYYLFHKCYNKDSCFPSISTICKETKLSRSTVKRAIRDLERAGFIDKECDTKWYPQKDYHTMYVVEIEKVLVD